MPDVTGTVKSLSELAPATIARALAFASCSAGKELLSMIPMLVTACKDAVPGLSACPMHPRLSPAPAQAEDTFASNNIQLVPGTEPSIHPNTSTPPASPPSSFTYVAHHSSQHAVLPVSTSLTLTPSERNVTLISHSLAILTPPSSSAGDFSFVEMRPHALLSFSEALNSTRDVPQAVQSSPLLLSLPGLLSTLTGRRSLITDASTQTACHRKSQLHPSSCSKVLFDPLGTVHMPLSIHFLSGLESSLTSGLLMLSNTFKSLTDGLSPTEMAPPVQPSRSKAPNSAWDVLDAVRMLLALSFIPIDRLLVISNTSSKAELGASPPFSPISYDCVEFWLPTGICASSSMCLLLKHDTPSTSELLVTSFTVPKPPGYSTKPGNDACDFFNFIRIYVDPLQVAWRL
ncbi:hypothetical protein Hypma_013145 [Hypsizygus marmoreus]|uniref:Uncharacterized protein n=1 Tax=Hypsizygus marmoreus TaxID=39966 RepID=A0A369JHZ1_HYPMA|nr:hypothetical protein Hypma_013145 [Hypsizygus marmoreus]